MLNKFAITRAVTFDWTTNKPLGFALLDPVITHMNYKFMGDKYKALTRWMMGESISAAQYLDPFPTSMYSVDDLKEIDEVLRNRSGWKSLKGATLNETVDNREVD